MAVLGRNLSGPTGHVVAFRIGTVLRQSLPLWDGSGWRIWCVFMLSGRVRIATMLQDGFSDRRAAKTWGKFAIFAMLFTENDNDYKY